MAHALFRRPLLGSVLALVLLILALLRPAATSSAPTDTGPNLSGSVEPLAPRLATAAWSGWQNLGKVDGQTALDVTIGQNQDGHLEMLAWAWYGAGTDHTVYRRNQTAVNGTSWTAWTSLGTLEAGTFSPAVITNPFGRLEVFARADAVNAGSCTSRVGMKMIAQTAPNGGWGTWWNMGLPPGMCYFYEPYAGLNADGRIDVFTLGDDGNIYHRWQTAPGSSWNSAWASIGAPSSGSVVYGQAVGNNADGRIALFAITTTGELWHSWQNTVNDELSFNTWTGFGKPSGSVDLRAVMLEQNADGRLDVFTLGSDGKLYHKSQVAPNSYWSQWGNLGSPSATTTVAVGMTPKTIRMKDGRLAVFALGTGSASWVIAQTQASGNWGSWTSLGKPSGQSLASTPAASKNKNGTLVVAATDMSGNLWVNYEQSFLFLPLIRR